MTVHQMTLRLTTICQTTLCSVWTGGFESERERGKDLFVRACEREREKYALTFHTFFKHF
jgi:hypothetical protein